ncbi:TorF family putative porin [Falsiroseomonas oryzae]|uniref:TorF family putative porin n=1 Tax=Falsiroseomonas oryzae TaxID=2766473 RepID=UPI0022EB7B88|nr:TorF family putative porin [Roseomonas sp. MO-31]
MNPAQTLGVVAIVGAALLAPAAASAQQTVESLGLTITTTPAATTDYLFRGISQTRGRPAVQLTLDVEHESGLYVGAFVSNANFAGTNIRQEVDGMFGYRFSVAGVKLDVGATYFGYPGYDKPPGGFEAAWWEANIRASYEFEPFKLVGLFAWSPNYNFESGNAFYLEGGLDVTLPLAFTLGLRAGYQWIDRNFPSVNRPQDGAWGAPDYGVFSASLSREIAFGVIGAVTVSQATINDAECFGGQKICGTRVVATLTRPF